MTNQPEPVSSMPVFAIDLDLLSDAQDYHSDWTGCQGGKVTSSVHRHLKLPSQRL